jgi:hypothetical protein
VILLPKETCRGILVAGILGLVLAPSSVGETSKFWTLFYENPMSTDDRSKEDRSSQERPAEERPGEWPELSQSQYIAGFTADRAAVQSGRAVFVLEQDGVPASRPLPLLIPQYAYHIDRTTGKKTPCIVVQAEQFRGVKIIGCRDFINGKEIVDVDSSFEFLGDKRQALLPISSSQKR